MLPIAAVIGLATAVGLGTEYRWHDWAEMASGRVLTAVLWVLLPVVIFFNIGTLELTASVGAGLGFAYLALAATITVAYFVGTRILRLSRPSVGALMGTAALGNTGYLGLPFTVALFGFDELPNALAYDVLVSSFALVTVGFSVGAAFGTRGERARDRLQSFFTRNPPLWATIAGLVVPVAFTPDWAVDASRVLVLVILPLGFFAVGVTLASEAGATGRFPPRLTPPVAWAVGLKLLLLPAVLVALSTLLLDVPDSYVSQAGMACALNMLVVAKAYGLDRALIAAAILYSTGVVVAVGAVLAVT